MPLINLLQIIYQQIICHACWIYSVYLCHWYSQIAAWFRLFIMNYSKVCNNDKAADIHNFFPCTTPLMSTLVWQQLMWEPHSWCKVCISQYARLTRPVDAWWSLIELSGRFICTLMYTWMSINITFTFMVLTLCLLYVLWLQ